MNVLTNISGGCCKIRESVNRLTVMTVAFSLNEISSETSGARAIQKLANAIEKKFKTDGLSAQAMLIYTQYDNISNRSFGQIVISTQDSEKHRVSGIVYNILASVSGMQSPYYYTNQAANPFSPNYDSEDVIDYTIRSIDNILIVSQYKDGLYHYYISHSVGTNMAVMAYTEDLSLIDNLTKTIGTDTKTTIEVLKLSTNTDETYITRSGSNFTFKYAQTVKNKVVFSHQECTLFNEASEELIQAMPLVLHLNSYGYVGNRVQGISYQLMDISKIKIRDGVTTYNNQVFHYIAAILPIDFDDMDRTKRFVSDILIARSQGRGIGANRWKSFVIKEEDVIEDATLILEKFLTVGEGGEKKEKQITLINSIVDATEALREYETTLERYRAKEQKLQPLPYIPQLKKGDSTVGAIVIHPAARIRKVNNMNTLCLTPNEEVVL